MQAGMPVLHPLQANRSVVGMHDQRGPAGVKFTPQLVLTLGTRDRNGEIGLDVAVAGVHIQIGGKGGWQAQSNVAVAGAYAPFGGQSRSVVHFRLDTSVAGMQTQQIESSSDDDPAVAGLSVQGSVQRCGLNASIAGG